MKIKFSIINQLVEGFLVYLVMNNWYKVAELKL